MGAGQPKMFLEEKERNGHRNRQSNKIGEGDDLAAAIVDQITLFKVPPFVQRCDNQVDH